MRAMRTFAAPMSLATLAWLIGGSPLLLSCAKAQAPAGDNTPLMAREFEEFPQGDVIRAGEFKGLRFKVMKMCQAGTFENPEEQQDFEKYFKYKIAELTWAASIPDLPKKIGEIKKQDLVPSGRAGTPTAHDRLNQMLLAALSNFAVKDTYHPAVRVNCVLLLGNLDQTEPDGLGANAVPLPAALDKLLAIAGDAKQLDGVRVAAMTGINRHARASANSMNPQGRAAAVKALTSPIVMDNPSGQQWMRRSAAKTLGIMAAKWPEANRPEVVALAQQLMGDGEATLTTRCEAANALGQLDKAAYSGAPVPQLASAAGFLAAELGKSAGDPNLKYIDEAGKLSYMTSQLLCVHNALKGADGNRGLQAAAPNDAKPFVKDLLTKVAELVDISANNKLQVSDAQSRLAAKGQDLETWLKGKGNGGEAVAAGGS
jgi:hypothetical protein